MPKNRKPCPNMMALAAQKTYQDKMSGIEEDRLDMQNKYYDQERDNAKTGNWINSASLGLQGLNTANQLAGGNLIGGAAKLATDSWDAISEGFSSLWA